MFSEPDFNKSKYPQVRDEFKNLVIQMLDKNQKTRIKISDIKNNTYFSGFDFELLIQKKMKTPKADKLVFIDKVKNYNKDEKEPIEIKDLSPNTQDETIDTSF
jgi:hypothetical protein